MNILYKLDRSRLFVFIAALLLALPLFLSKAAVYGSVTTIHSFNDGNIANDTWSPQAALTLGPDGNFYGTTGNGGAGGVGAVFKMTPDGSITILHSFKTIANDGASPFASLTLGPDGNFYGITPSGGSAGYGAAFKISPDGTTYSILRSFGTTANDVPIPGSRLTLGSDGNFYGTTRTGGSANHGTLYKMTPAGSATIIHTFGSIANDGNNPTGAVTLGPDGNFYGTTYEGGTANVGTAYKITPNGATYTILHSFGDGSSANEGKFLYAGLTLGHDGNFYGVTQQGGSANHGTVFKMTPAGSVTILHSFGDFSTANDGNNPLGAVTLGPDGNFYGTTQQGGTANVGTVYKITPDGTTYAVLHSFGDGSSANDGSNPTSSLTPDPDGSLYGTVPSGGSRNMGMAFRVNNAILISFDVSAPGTSTTGAPLTFTVTARDVDGNIATNYFGTVHFTSTDPLAVLPADTLLVNGTGSFTATLNSTGNQIIAATDSINSNIAGTTANINVAPGADANHFVVTSPNTVTAGTSFNVSVTAKDQYNNRSVSYSGTVHFTSSDPKAILPANATLTNGTGTFTVKFKTAGNRTVTATDTSAPAITGISNNIVVAALPAGHFTITAPSSTTAGTAFNFTVKALDQFGNIDTAYGSTVHFTSSDVSAILPADTTLLNGVATLNATIQAAGNQVITGTDTDSDGIIGTSNLIAVAAAPTVHLIINGPASAANGSPFPITVSAQDQYGNPAYMGEGHFTSSDPRATLPPNFTIFFGVGVSVTLKSAGMQTITVTDVNNPANSATLSVNVTAGPPTHITMTAPATSVSGSPFNVTVTARDADENVAAGYTGTIHFTCTDPAASLPADATLTNGTGSFSATLLTGATQTLRAQDTVNTAFNTTATIVVTANHFTISTPATANAQTVVNTIVTAKDQLNNTVTGYTGTVHLTSTDPSAVLPADFTLTAGTKQVSVKLRTSGLQTITATDTASPSLTGTSGSINVNPVVYKLIITGPTTAIAGVATNYTVNASDSVGNTVTSYSGTVHVTSTDPNAALPGDITLTNGTASFPITFKTATTVSIAAVDAVTPSLKGGLVVVVSGGAVASFVVTAPASCTSGVAFYATITAKDAYGNLAKSYTGTVRFTSTDLLAVLPLNTTVPNGTKQVSLKLKTKAPQTLTAIDTVSAGITGTSAPIAVN